MNYVLFIQSLCPNRTYTERRRRRRERKHSYGAMGKQQWIQKAIKHRGSFDTYCRRHHMKGATGKCITMGEHSRSAVTRQRANLANTLEHLNRRRVK